MVGDKSNTILVWRSDNFVFRRIHAWAQRANWRHPSSSGFSILTRKSEPWNSRALCSLSSFTIAWLTMRPNDDILDDSSKCRGPRRQSIK